MTSNYTVPGMTQEQARQVAERLQDRLVALLDLHLTLKHVHWNVVGPTFIAIHEMLDPQVDAVRQMSDEAAERIATLGYEPVGTPGFIVERRSWDDYNVNRAGAQEHLAALDVVYNGVIGDHRGAIQQFEDLDVVSQDMLINQAGQLEMFQWFIRAHLEDSSGTLPHGNTGTIHGAAEAVGGEARVPRSQEQEATSDEDRAVQARR